MGHVGGQRRRGGIFAGKIAHRLLVELGKSRQLDGFNTALPRLNVAERRTLNFEIRSDIFLLQAQILSRLAQSLPEQPTLLLVTRRGTNSGVHFFPPLLLFFSQAFSMRGMTCSTA